ncbi:MAG: ABC-three component system protein [Candidatus Promineifilaceae bacterium]
MHEKDIDNFYALLTDWWQSQIIRHLEEKAKTPITQQAVRAKIQRLRDEFSSRNLPIHFRDKEPPFPPEVTRGKVQFVKQLEVIQAMRDIEDAKRDYIKAAAERHEWEKTEPLIGAELENYEKRLRDHWKRIRNLQLDMFELDKAIDKADEPELRKLGLGLYQEIRKLNIPIRV